MVGTRTNSIWHVPADRALDVGDLRDHSVAVVLPDDYADNRLIGPLGGTNRVPWNWMP